MTKDDLVMAVDEHIAATRAALQTVYDALNQGQQKKLLKNDAVKALMDRYGVITEDTE